MRGHIAQVIGFCTIHTVIQEIWYDMAPSPFGTCLLGVTDHGISNLLFVDSSALAEAKTYLSVAWPDATLIRDPKRLRPYFAEIFKPAQERPELPLVVSGTPFQRRVWETLLAIPEGKVASYADIALAIGSPRAVRAVGAACGKNPISWLIPCHRVLPSSGQLGHYHWGATRKAAMLTWEAAVHKIALPS